MINYNSFDHEMTMMCDEDQCDQESAFFGAFRECIVEAKEEGWKISMKSPGEWTHVCPFCAQKQSDPTEVFK